MSDEVRRFDPLGALSAFGRSTYSSLVTIVVVSVGTSLAALPVVTLGPALTGAVAALSEAVAAKLRGERRTERDRFAVFVDTAKTEFRRTLPFGLIVFGAVAATAWYLNAALTTGSTPFLVAAALGVYGVVLSTVWVLRAASLLVAAGPDRAPPTTELLRDAGLHLLDAPRFSVLQSVLVGILLVVCVGLGITVVLLLPGLLALLEVVCYEEREGDGAVAVVKAYQGTPHRGDGA